MAMQTAALWCHTDALNAGTALKVHLDYWLNMQSKEMFSNMKGQPTHYVMIKHSSQTVDAEKPLITQYAGVSSSFAILAQPLPFPASDPSYWLAPLLLNDSF